MKVKNFSYNGLFVNPMAGLAPYTAQFVKWSDDPGITICKCSDGEKRRIPSLMLIGFSKRKHPAPSYPHVREHLRNHPVYYGKASHS